VGAMWNGIHDGPVLPAQVSTEMSTWEGVYVWRDGQCDASGP
jgi:hypothetical protein